MLSTRVTQPFESCSISRTLRVGLNGLLIYNYKRFQMTVGCQTVCLTN